ncbi:50S ribosomal protein L28 [Fuchsiella alkaliacetigena]|uniref:50S ribosomal protein L28 n=1 Tax=Fuchsiella alkaliacetigena TaxID=957042 RepID=UPI00200AE661|nr:50S ribosomal protein L28 [Fuchsiella alkaliacetigena]MCK8823605.1 50S ribosomal protein L28 [Fuchsiella alkaliacetigena]
MAKYCEICGKGANKANRVTRRGKAKKEGGVGRNVTQRAKRVQKPNLQKVKAMIDGTKKRINVCTKCIKAGKVTRAY